jgi:hypothetical protein
MIELVIQKIFLEKGKVDFMLNFEDYGKEKGEISNGESIFDGILKMLHENPNYFEPVFFFFFI